MIIFTAKMLGDTEAMMIGFRREDLETLPDGPFFFMLDVPAGRVDSICMCMADSEEEFRNKLEVRAIELAKLMLANEA